MNLQSASEMRSTWTTVREAIFDFLRSVGVDTFFGNPGSTELPMLNRWPSDIRYVLALQEASVVGMADGYARATGKAAFVNLHSAAGLGHSLGNVFTAYKNRAPMVIIAGQQSRDLLLNEPFLGATDAPSFPKPYVKYSIEPARPEDVPAAIAQAYRIAMQRPWGPTFVSVPVDDWTARCRPVRDRQVSVDTAPDPLLIQKATAMLLGAKAPVLVVGPEVDEENAGPALVDLAERMNIPVLAAPFAARVVFPEDHPLFAGFLPAAPGKVSDALEKYDVVGVIGAPVFTYHVSGQSRLVESDISLFHLTTDRMTAASAPLGLSILGSLKFSVPALAALLPKTTNPASSRKGPPKSPKVVKEITPAYFFYCLGKLWAPGMVMMEESPSTRPIMQDFVRIREWGGFYTMASGGLGYGLPGAVGLGLARPDQKIVCVIGDGSFMYSPQALWTAVQHNVNLTILVLNNGGYGAMRSFSRTLQVRDVPGIDVQGLDFLDLAKSMGCPAQRLRTSDELEEALEENLKSTGPRLLEVIIDPEIQILY